MPARAVAEPGRTRAAAPAVLCAVLYFVTALPVLAAHRPEPAVLAATCALAGLLIAASLVDLASFRLPNSLSAAVGLVGIGLTLWVEPAAIAGRIAAMVVGYAALAAVAALYQRSRGRPGLGLGDAKLLGAAGAWVGLSGLASVVLMAALAALAVVLAGALAGRRWQRDTRIAFGPYLAFGLWLVWLYGPVS